jgi:hypothetical protein
VIVSWSCRIVMCRVVMRKVPEAGYEFSKEGWGLRGCRPRPMLTTVRDEEKSGNRGRCGRDNECVVSMTRATVMLLGGSDDR